MKIHIAIASVFGIGFMRGGGTVAAIIYCICWILLPPGFVLSYWQLFSTLLICVIGTHSSNEVDAIWGKDSSRVVIDEVAGMAVALLYVPHNIKFLLAALFLFRLFDILKPFGIRKLESFPKGWGVMADDVAAGLYSLLILQGIKYFDLLN